MPTIQVFNKNPPNTIVMPGAFDENIGKEVSMLSETGEELCKAKILAVVEGNGGILVTYEVETLPWHFKLRWSKAAADEYKERQRRQAEEERKSRIASAASQIQFLNDLGEVLEKHGVMIGVYYDYGFSGIEFLFPSRIPDMEMGCGSIGAKDIAEKTAYLIEHQPK